MSLTALAHRKAATVTIVTNTTTAILDYIYTAITAANDYAGTAFPSPLTVTKYQNVGVTEALYGTFTTGALTHKFLIAGVNAARTPLMGGSHTWTAQYLMGGLTKNAGAFATWDHATLPFTSGQSTGLVKFFDPSVVTGAKVHAIITAETLWVFIESSTNTTYGIGIGALVDPETTTSGSAESDGRIYGVMTSGTALISLTLNGTSASFGYHSASNNAVHFLCFNAGLSTLQATARNCVTNTSTTTSGANADNEPFAMPIFVRNQTTDKLIGRLREIGFTRDAKHGQVQSPGGVDRWHYVGGSTSADCDCLAYLI